LASLLHVRIRDGRKSEPANHELGLKAGAACPGDDGLNFILGIGAWKSFRFQAACQQPADLPAPRVVVAQRLLPDRVILCCRHAIDTQYAETPLDTPQV